MKAAILTGLELPTTLNHVRYLVTRTTMRPVDESYQPVEQSAPVNVPVSSSTWPYLLGLAALAILSVVVLWRFRGAKD